MVRNRGRYSATPGVSTQPGCMLSTRMSVPANRRAHESASTTCIRLVRA